MDRSISQPLRDLIAASQTFVHVTHVNPDGDGFGSALAMHRWLLSLGKSSHFVLPAPVPRRLAFLPREGEVEVIPEGSELPKGAVVMIYDMSTKKRLGPLEQAVDRCGGPVVVFDHHDGAIDFECIAAVEPPAGATAQVVFDLLEGWGAEITLDIAVPLYVALIADTGSFNYGKTTPHTHHVAARLLEAGVDPLEIHGKLEGSRTLHSVRLGAEVLKTLSIDEADPRLAHATMTLAQFSRGGQDALDALDLVNHTIALEGVLAGVLFIEASAGASRLSMRSKGSTSIVEAARSFGGGGHRNAAGATVQRPLREIKDEVLARLRAELSRQHGPPAR